MAKAKAKTTAKAKRTAPKAKKRTGPAAARPSVPASRLGKMPVQRARASAADEAEMDMRDAIMNGTDEMNQTREERDRYSLADLLAAAREKFSDDVAGSLRDLRETVLRWDAPLRTLREERFEEMHGWMIDLLAARYDDGRVREIETWLELMPRFYVRPACYCPYCRQWHPLMKTCIVSREKRDAAELDGLLAGIGQDVGRKAEERIAGPLPHQEAARATGECARLGPQVADALRLARQEMLREFAGQDPRAVHGGMADRLGTALLARLQTDRDEGILTARALEAATDDGGIAEIMARVADLPRFFVSSGEYCPVCSRWHRIGRKCGG